MRKGKWKSRKGMALLALTLAFVLGLSGTGLLDTHAAGPVETEDPCRLVIDTEALFTSIKKDYAEYVLSNGTHGITYTDVMNKVALTAKVYKVAGISAGAKFTAVPAFADAELTDGTTFDTAVSTVNSATQAETWEDMTLAVSDMVTADAIQPTKTEDVFGYNPDEPEITFGRLDQYGEVLPEAGLETGLYLVMIDEVVTPYYTYIFAPCLVSLPDNNYDPEDSATNDDWIYNVTIVPKLGREERTGSLQIQKELSEMSLLPENANAMFVFHVKVEPLSSSSTEPYDDYAAITFDAAGTKTVEVTGIPAGASVTVTEEYSGGGYELAPDVSSSVTQIVKADGTEDDPVEPVTFSFTNVPDDSLIGGNGVINNIAPDGKGGWDWTQITESGSTTGEVME